MDEERPPGKLLSGAYLEEEEGEDLEIRGCRRL